MAETKQKLVVSQETFFKNLLELVKSGVTFEAIEVENVIEIKFTGGY